MDLMKFMAGSGCLCLACYVAASISDNPVIGLAGCIMCGFLLELCGQEQSVYVLGGFLMAELPCLDCLQWRETWVGHLDLGLLAILHKMQIMI